ncbi:MAG: substrate-binding domain-containing protein [Caldilineaceae bacterium]
MQQGKQWIWLLLILLISAACSSQTGQSNAAPTSEDEVIARFIASAPSRPQNKATATPLSQKKPASATGLPLPDVEPLHVTGDLLIAGSVTVAPVTRAVYKRFVNAGYNGTIKIQEIGTSTGFKIYCETGESDIAMALRPMLQTEFDVCLKHGRTPVALQIGFNPIPILANKDNTFVNNVTHEQLVQMFTVGRWSDVAPNWPAQAITRYVPNQAFGVFTYFVDLLLNSDAQILQNAPFTTLVDDQTMIPQNIVGNVNAIGFSDYPLYIAYADELKVVRIDGMGPDLTEATNSAYPLITPMLLYTDPDTLQAKPQVAQFLIFYLAHLDEALAEAHEFPVNVERLERTKIILAQAMNNVNYLHMISQQLKQTPTATPLPSVTPTLQPTETLTSMALMNNTPVK